MPKDNIKRAVDKGQGGSGEDYVEIRYEGFGPGGVGIIVEASTDNKNRAASEIRSTFSKNGGNLGETGSVSFGVEQVGEIQFPIEAGDEDAMMEAAIDAGASDVETDETAHFIYTERENLTEVAGALEGQFGEIEAKSTKLIWKPSNMVPVTGEDVEKLMRLLDLLDDLDDVQNLYDNSDISDEELEQLAG